MEILSYALGKKSSGGGTSGRDWTQIGYTKEPSAIQSGFDYAKQIQQNWDATITNRTEYFSHDGKLIFFPSVDTSNITNATNMFQYSTVMSLADDFDFSHLTNCTGMFYYSSLKYVDNVVLGNPQANNMFGYVNDLKVNNFVATSNDNSLSFSSNQNITINTLGIKAGTRAIFSNVTNLDIKQINNYDNHTSRSRALIGSSTMTNRTIDEFLKYFKTLTSQSSSYKKLSSMGFSSANCDQAILSSHWQDLVDAGWVTGY